MSIHQKHVLVHVTASLSRGGAETVLFNLVRGLQPHYTQYVISFRDGVFREQFEQLGVPVYVVKGNIYTRMIRVWRLLNQLDPAVIHALLWSACALVRLYSRVRGVPSICAIHSPFNTNTGNSRLRDVLDRCTAKWAAYTVFVSHAVISQAHIAHFVPLEQRVLIPNGIACEDICASATGTPKTREQYGLCSDHFVIGTVGRLVPVKNQKLLLLLVARLHKRYPQVRLLIVGDGPLREVLEQQVRADGLAAYVRIVSGLGVEHYQLFDCFVQPSFTEGLSMALLEAMVCKVPVIAASDSGEHDVIVYGQTGFLCKPHDLEQLIQIIARIIQEPELCRGVAVRASRLMQERYTVECMIVEYKNLADRVILGKDLAGDDC